MSKNQISPKYNLRNTKGGKKRGPKTVPKLPSGICCQQSGPKKEQFCVPGPAGGAVVSLGFWKFEGKDSTSAAPVGGPRRFLTGSQQESGAGLGREPPPLRPAANHQSGPQTPKNCSSVAHPPGSSRVTRSATETPEQGLPRSSRAKGRSSR